jgi:hypothetical protein
VPSPALNIEEEVPKSSYTLFKYFAMREVEELALASSS